MKKLILLLITILTCCDFIIAQSNFTTFSELVGRRSASYANITPISDGYLVQSFLVKNGNDSNAFVYKINTAGKIVDSMDISFNGKGVYSDEIIRKGNLNYQLGYVFPSKTVLKSPKRCLTVFDDNLKVLKKFEYDIVPPDGFAQSNTCNDIVGDTIISVRRYERYDSLFNPLPGRPSQIEYMGINGENYGIINTSKQVAAVSDAVVVKDRIFIFGSIEAFAPVYNVFAVGEFTLDGKFVKGHEIPTEFFNSGMAKSHKNLIYHVNIGKLYQRNAKFELLKTVTLKQEPLTNGSFPSYSSFAFDNKDNLFYLHVNQDGTGTSVFKLNDKLDILWEKKMGNIGSPEFVIQTNEGGCLVGYVSGGFNNDYIFLLYKLDDLGNITSVETIRQPTQQQSLFYPNPFQLQLTLQQGIEGATEVYLYDMSGRTVGTYTLENNSIKVDDFLPVGTYMAQLKNKQGKVLGVQTVMKE